MRRAKSRLSISFKNLTIFQFCRTLNCNAPEEPEFLKSLQPSREKFPALSSRQWSLYFIWVCSIFELEGWIMSPIINA